MILVTGATGIVGSHMVLELLKSGRDVSVLHRSGSDLKVLNRLLKFHGLNQEPALAEGDINDPLSLMNAMEGCGEVYHCAAKVSFSRRHESELAMVNIKGTQNVVDVCLQHGARLCYISSTATIGEEYINGFRTEESTWVSDKGKSAYALTKRYAEFEVFRGFQEGLSGVIVNPGIVIGPGNWGQSSTSIFLAGIRGMNFYTSGSNGFVDARDIAEISIDLMQQPELHQGRHLLIGENMPFHAFFTSAAEIAGKQVPRYKVPDPIVKTMVFTTSWLERLRLNPSKIQAESLKSSLKKAHYSSEKIREKGYGFRTVKEALAYTYDFLNQQA